MLAACLLLAACASSGALNAARIAEQQQDYDLAVAEYTKAARERPDDRGIRLALDRAKLRASQDHIARARRHLATGHTEEALIEFQLAAELNPANGDIQDEMRALRSQLRTQVAVDRDGQTTLETLIKDSLAAPLPGADVPTDVTLPDTLIFREASARDIFTAIGKFANLSVVFDPAFRDQPVSIDLRQATIDQALTSLASSTRQLLARHRAAHGRGRCPTPPPSAASTRRRSSARSSSATPISRRPSTCCASSSTRAAWRRWPPPTPSPSRTRRSASPPPAASSRPSTRPAPRW